MRQTRTFGRFTTVFSAASLDPPSAEVLRGVPFGDATPLPSNAPLRLDDPDLLYIVASGEVDLFYVSRGSDPYRTVRRYVGTLWSGEVVAGVRSDVEPDSTLVAVGFGDAAIHAIPLSVVNEQAPAVARISRALIVGAAETIGRAMHRASRSPAQPVEPELGPRRLKRGTTITSPGETVWIAVQEGELRFGGTVPISASGDFIPLPRGVWMTVSSDSAVVEVADTLIALGAGTPSALLIATWKVFLAWIARTGERDDAVERARLERKIEGERRQHTQALRGLSSLLQRDAEEIARPSHGDALLDACVAVGADARITFKAPPGWSTVKREPILDEEDRDRDLVATICSASHVRYRRVVLREGWWKSDSGPLLGFLTKGHVPVALLSSAQGGYSVFDPATGKRSPVTESVASTIESFAYTFYRPAPFESLRIRDLGKLVIHDIWPDLRRVLVLAGIGAMLGLALPAVTGKMFNDVIPTGAFGNALTLFGALVAVAVAASAFELARALALIRVEGRSNAVLQAAIVDRLLALPAKFFRQYTVGDLSARAEAINGARQILTGVAITSILGGALTITSLGLMVWINARLAIVAAVVLALGVVVTAIVGVYTLKFERRRETLEGTIGALVFELLGGIAKINVAAAEARMFALWGNRFRELKVVSFRAGLGAAALAVFNDVLPILASAALFMVAMKVFAVPGALLTGDFIAFYAAFGGALAAGTAVSNTLVAVLNVVPLMERAAPILATAPEVDDARPDPGPISGRIEMAHVTFGYVADSPPIVDDVSFEIRPGEFVAFVGPSGAGKSTILRLLLGFERPDRGAVYFDGHDLASVDVGAIRRQCAVVLQQSRLLAGDIFTNIVGASPLTIEDAWHAAELAGLADDIRSMPMGMHTVVSEGGSTLSGGQRQRLLIARALVRRPRVVFFDEATSALDNRSQEIVTRSLEEMRASRIVIAHRLTTVQRADRIFVMSGGRIVQQGRFERLLEQEGLFQQLAARQLV